MSKKYGIMIGAFQPFHEGHRSIYNFIKDSGMEPIILMFQSPTEKRLVGSGDARECIRVEFPETIVRRVTTLYYNSMEFFNIIKSLEIDFDIKEKNITVFLHCTENDEEHKIQRNKILTTNLKKLGINFKELKFMDEDISSKGIREHIVRIANNQSYNSEKKQEEVKKICNKLMKNSLAAEILFKEIRYKYGI